jgi:trk system potassium uptake protein TrkA
VAENLVSENTDVTVVDVDQSRLKYLQDHLDLNTVWGDASHPSILKSAGCEDADMVLAVTRSDQTNLVACKLADKLFRTPTKIARIRAADYLNHPEIFSDENFSVDLAICPEQIVTEYISKLIDFPEALQVLDFAAGWVQLVAMRALEGGPLVGHKLSDLRRHVPNVDTRVVAIFRQDRPLIPTGDTIVHVNDEVFFIAAKKNIRAVMCELQRLDRPTKRVMLAGGGNIGARVARALEHRYRVKIIEINKQAAQKLGAELEKTLVLTGDATDEEMLESESVEDMDVFCALTNDDENNIMSALLAKRMGADKVIALINRSAYVNLVQGGKIDIAVSPAQATIGTLLARVRRGDVVAVHSLRRGAAEALEIVAHGDTTSSKVVGRRVEQLVLPEGATIGALVRNLPAPGEKPASATQVVIAHHDTVIESEDHVIVFVTNKRIIPKVEKLFQVGIGFI